MTVPLPTFEFQIEWEPSSAHDLRQGNFEANAPNLEATLVPQGCLPITLLIWFSSLMEVRHGQTRTNPP